MTLLPRLKLDAGARLLWVFLLQLPLLSSTGVPRASAGEFEYVPETDRRAALAEIDSAIAHLGRTGNILLSGPLSRIKQPIEDSRFFSNIGLSFSQKPSVFFAGKVTETKFRSADADYCPTLTLKTRRDQEGNIKSIRIEQVKELAEFFDFGNGITAIANYQMKKRPSNKDKWKSAVARIQLYNNETKQSTIAKISVFNLYRLSRDHRPPGESFRIVRGKTGAFVRMTTPRN